jgi:putative Holliday junction resolvase
VAERILAVDHGTKRVGLAMTDELGLVLPLPLLESEGKDEPVAARVAELARERSVTKVLVGLPINMDGTHGPAAQKVEKFCAMIEKDLTGTGIVVLRRDERLTSWEAEAALSASRVHWKDRKGKVDTIAAQIMLRDYLAETDPSYRAVPEDAVPPPDPEKSKRQSRRDRRDKFRGRGRR